MYNNSRYPGAMMGREGPYDQLKAFIERACNPMLPEPNLGLNLEIADHINAKKANFPREAVVEVLKSINSRNTHQSMLGLNLLDTLVKNCGYPMHLQVATKDFLNELVRRFPERPPVFPPPPMNKILELIHEWKNTICVTSKHKEDLTNIRDMHRLLGYKGYRFRDFDKRAAQVLNPTDGLKSPDELEEEDRQAQAAKLQELIRRGTPKDLAAAQELMKVMAGAEPGKKPDYASQTAKELASIQHRILMLNEMLDNVKPNERFADGDAFDQIATRSRNVQPKIQKWIGSAEENDDAENIDKLLLMNDLINNVLDRYEEYKKGNRNASAEINPAFQAKTSSKSSSSSKAKAAAAAPNLIDFDEPVQPSSSSTSNGSSGLEAFGLEGLSLGGPSSSPSVTQQQGQPNTGTDLLAGLSFGPSTSSIASQPQNFYQQYQPQIPAQQQTQAVSWGNLNNAGRSSGLNTNNGSTTANPMYNQAPASPANAATARPGSGQSMRPSTPGAINLGMMGSMPDTPANIQHPSYDSFGFANQPQAAPPKKKDPFEDLLL